MNRFFVHTCIGNSKGVSFVLMALTMLVICCMLGLSIDIAYVYVVKGQLQNAADAGALAGAGAMFPGNGPQPSYPPPNFGEAQIIAKTFVKKNRAAGDLLVSGDIESIDAGYWNLGQVPVGIQTPAQATVPAGRCSGSGIACSASFPCTATEVCMIQDVPAVAVTVKKEVPTFFATVFGFHTLEPSATAVAARGFPKSGRPFPVAVSKCMVENYFAQKPLPSPPTEVLIWGPYSGAPGCNTGQWTSLTANSNSAVVIRDLMYSTPTPLSIGDNIQVTAGNMEVLYGYIQQDFIGKVVQLPVVQDPVLSINTLTPITGFVSFRIDKVIMNGAASQLGGHFLSYYSDKTAGHPGGPSGNIVTPPVLVK